MSEKKAGFLTYLVQAWLVLALSVGFGAALAGVAKVTRSRIEQNVKDFIAAKLVEMYGEGTTTDEAKSLDVQIDKRDRTVLCYPAIKGGKRIGWGILAVGQGYDTLTLLVGVDERVDRLVGFRVVDSLETPGIGDRIQQPGFFEQFEGKDAAKPLSGVAEGKETTGNQVNTISGATLSSVGVVNIINSNLAAVREKLIAASREDR